MGSARAAPSSPTLYARTQHAPHPALSLLRSHLPSAAAGSEHIEDGLLLVRVRFVPSDPATMNIFKKKVDPKGAATHSLISFVAGGWCPFRFVDPREIWGVIAAVLFGAHCCLASIIRGVEVPSPPPELRRRGSRWISASARPGGRPAWLGLGF